jgi:23S rRNA pseudouridine2605 synthase
VRLNQFLARAGAGSRREADRWIRADRVRVNGAPPEGAGPDVEPLRDRITLDGRLLVWESERRYVAYNKPPGLLVSRRGQGGRRTIFDALGDRARGLQSVGRLDLESEGLLLLTDDGTLAEVLLHPRTGLKRVYRVWVEPVPDAPALRRLTRGAAIDGVPARPLSVALDGVERGLGVLQVELGEGKKREVRLLCRSAGLRVRRLLRTQFGPIRLGTLPVGTVRSLTTAEIQSLQRAATLKGT